MAVKPALYFIPKKNQEGSKSPILFNFAISAISEKYYLQVFGNKSLTFLLVLFYHHQQEKHK